MTTMKAILVREPGGPDELVLGDVPPPAPAPGELLIDIDATALNRADLLQRRGLYPPPPGASEMLGLECAGVVRAVGPNTRRFRVGDRVMALLGGGGYAETTAVDERLALPVPAALSSEHAAAIPEAFLTAYEALFTLARVTPEDTVLIHAAASGVGTAAVQLAHGAGARVIASAGASAKLEAVRALGADVTINYKERDFAEAVLEATAGRGASITLDFVGAAAAPGHLSCLAEGARWVVVGLLGGRRSDISWERVLSRRLCIFGLVMRRRSTSDKARVVLRFRRECLPLFEDGRLKPVIDSIFPLEQASAAHRRLESNRTIGKIVLQCRNGATSRAPSLP